MAAKERKRAAVSGLRDLAEEVGLQVNRRKADLSGADFDSSHAEVLAACATEDQRRRAEEARSRYCSGPPPPVPGAQAAGGPFPRAGVQLATDVPGGGGAEDEQGGVRFRSSSCLFTRNSRSFANCDVHLL